MIMKTITLCLIAMIGTVCLAQRPVRNNDPDQGKLLFTSDSVEVLKDSIRRMNVQIADLHKLITENVVFDTIQIDSSQNLRRYWPRSAKVMRQQVDMLSDLLPQLLYENDVCKQKLEHAENKLTRINGIAERAIALNKNILESHRRYVGNVIRVTQSMQDVFLKKPSPPAKKVIQVTKKVTAVRKK